jgi:hypothetical protein
MFANFGIGALVSRFQRTSAADLKFLYHPRQTRTGTSNRKRHWHHSFASTLCFPKFVREYAEPDHELRKAGTSKS